MWTHILVPQKELLIHFIQRQKVEGGYISKGDAFHDFPKLMDFRWWWILLDAKNILVKECLHRINIYKLKLNFFTKLSKMYCDFHKKKKPKVNIK